MYFLPLLPLILLPFPILFALLLITFLFPREKENAK